MDKVTCQICGKEYKSLMSHIRGTHKLEIREYTDRFPNSVLVSDSVKKKVSKSCKGKGRPPGTPMQEWQKNLYSEMFSGEGNGFYGRKHSNTTKKKMSDNHADFNGDKNPLRKALADDPIEMHKKLSDVAKARWESYSEEKRAAIAEKFSIIGASRPHKNTHKNHKSGTLQSKKAGRVFYRSSWEKFVIEFLDACEEVESFTFEEFHLPYIDRAGKKRRTIIDFLAKLVNGKTVMIDVKPEGLLDYNNNRHKQKAYKKYCDENGIVYFLFSKRDMRLLEEIVRSIR